MNTPTTIEDSPEDDGQNEADKAINRHNETKPRESNGFSLDRLRSRSQEFSATSTARAGTCEVRKPKSDAFVRTSSDPEKRLEFDFLELESKDDVYLLLPEVTEQIARLNEREGKLVIKVRQARLVLSVERSGNSFLWLVKQSDSENTWLRSAENAATAAIEKWIRVVSNRPAKRYDFHEGASDPEPVWPSQTYEEMVNLAFENRIIDSLDHPVVQDLLGE